MATEAPANGRTPRAASSTWSSTTATNSAAPKGDGMATTRGVADPPMRDWQEDLLDIFQKAVLPASKRLFDLVRTHQGSDAAGGEESLEKALREYYASVNRGKLNDREMVWGEAEKKIETLLLSPPSDVNGGQRFLRVQYQAATGAGKTRSFMEIIRVHMASKNVRVDDGVAPVYVVVEPGRTLVAQTYNVLNDIRGLDCVCVCGSKVGTRVKVKDVTKYIRKQRERRRPTAIITTIHSAAGSVNRQGVLDHFTNDRIIVDLLILDESHKYAGANSDGSIGIHRMTFVKNAGAAMLKIGCTATPTVRSVPDDQSNGFAVEKDKKVVGRYFCQNDVNGVFGPVMCKYTYGEGLEDGVVAPLQLYLMDNSIPNTGTYQQDLDALLEEWDARGPEEPVGGKDPEPERVRNIIVDPLDATSPKRRASELPLWRRERLLMVCRIVREFALGNQTHVIAFCSSVEPRAIQLTDLVRFVCAKMIESIDGGTSALVYGLGKVERRRLVTLAANCFYEVSSSKGKVEPFKNAELGFLANLKILKEGVDIPHLTGVWYPDGMSITDSHGLIQSAGRGTRTAGGKACCVVFLPCFLPGAPLSFTLREDIERKAMLGKLEKRAKAAKSNWEGKFSEMATGLIEFFVQNQNEVHDFGIQLSSCGSDGPVWVARDPSTPGRTRGASPKAYSTDPAASVIAPGTKSPPQRRAAASPSISHSITSPPRGTTAVRNPPGPRRSSSTSSTGRSAHGKVDATSIGTPGAAVDGRRQSSADTPYVCGRHRDPSKIEFYPTDAGDYDSGARRCKVKTQNGTQCLTGKGK